MCGCVCVRTSCHSLQRVIFEASSLQFLSVFSFHLLIKRPSPSLSFSLSTVSPAPSSSSAPHAPVAFGYMIVKNVFTKLTLSQIKPYRQIKDFGEKREAEKKRVRKESQREGVKQRVCGGLIILKFSVCYFFFFCSSSCM